MPDLERDKKLKPWLTNSADLDMEMRQLGLKKKDLKLDENTQPIVLDVVNNPVDRVGLQFHIFWNHFPPS